MADFSKLKQHLLTGLTQPTAEDIQAETMQKGVSSLIDEGPMPSMTEDRPIQPSWDLMDILPADQAALGAVKLATLGKLAAGGLSGLAMGGLKNVAKKEIAEDVAKSATKLPMDEASRLARAKEMGFDTSKTYYHGTPNVIKEFKSNEPHYFTENPKFASGYANKEYARTPESDELLNLANQYKNRYEDWKKLTEKINPLYDDKPLSTLLPKEEIEKFEQKYGTQISNKSFEFLDPDFANDEMNTLYKHTKKLKSATGNVIPVHLKSENPYIYDFKGEFFNVRKQNEIIEKAKQLGHDSVIFKNIRDVTPNDTMFNFGEQVVMLKPENIRSKFANFDPSKSGSADLAAGLAGAGILGSMAAQSNEEQQEPYSKLRQYIK